MIHEDGDDDLHHLLEMEVPGLGLDLFFSSFSFPSLDSPLSFSSPCFLHLKRGGGMRASG